MIEELDRAHEQAVALMKGALQTGFEKLERSGATPEDLAGASMLIRHSLEGASKGLEKRAQFDGRSATVAGMVASLAKFFESAAAKKCDGCQGVAALTFLKAARQQDGTFDLRAVEFDLRGWSLVENPSVSGTGERAAYCPTCATSRGISAEAIAAAPANRIIE